MLTKFQVQFLIHATDPSSKEFPPTVSRDIQFVAVDSSLNEAFVNMNVKAESSSIAIEIAKKKLECFLDLYSLVGQNNFQIKDYFKLPTRITNLDEEDPIKVSHIDVHKYKQNFKRIKKIYSEYWSIINQRENEHLLIALYFFRSVTLTLNPIRTIIDGVVVLEALYSKKDERSEMKYRLASRITTLIASDVKTRKIMIKELRRLYDARSAIIHGSELSKIKNDWPIITWLRESIYRFLELNRIYKNHDKIIDMIDEAMLENSLRDKLRKQSEKLIIPHTQKKDSKSV